MLPRPGEADDDHSDDTEEDEDGSDGHQGEPRSCQVTVPGVRPIGSCPC